MQKNKKSIAADLELTCEQQDCAKSALEEHNFSIFREAGTGKSRVVSEICRRKGMKGSSDLLAGHSVQSV